MADPARRKRPDALDAARVLSLALLVFALVWVLVQAGVPAIAAGAVLQLGFLAAPLVYARLAGLRPLADSGFVPIPLRRLVFVAVASLGSLWLFNGLVHLQEEFARKAGYEERVNRQKEQIESGIEEVKKKGAAPALLLLILIPPLCEETFFRGILFRGLRERFGIGVTLASTTILFALFHPMDIQKVLMVILGGYLGFLAHITGSLWAPILAHFLNNLAVLTLMFIYGTNLPTFVAPWWMYVLSAVVFALGVTMLALDRRHEEA